MSCGDEKPGGDCISGAADRIFGGFQKANPEKFIREAKAPTDAVENGARAVTLRPPAENVFVRRRPRERKKKGT
jgi:hypothetical protein